MSTFSTEFTKNKCVIIPPIQREYVQPLNKSVITGFVDALIKAYSTGESKDLNYIYGIDNCDWFEPIDGQQRLTTLWLLHLYVAARCGIRLPVRFEYRTRDYAADFSVQLQANATKVFVQSECPSKVIKDANWFIESWEKDITVSSMLYALDIIHQQIKSTNVEINNMWDHMTREDSPVTFAFKSTKDLGDDVYVKLNARGKALSDFENLKSWLDDRLCEFVQAEGNNIDINFLKKWRESIDNQWTDLFWRNRNLNDLFPEEIDNEQMRLFFNIAYILWAQKNKSERQSMIRNLSDLPLLATLLNMTKEQNVTGDEVAEECLKRMRKSSVDFPLYLLDKLNIFDANFFICTKKILDGLISYEDEINLSLQAQKEEDFHEKIYFWDLSSEIKEPISFVCQLLMSEKEADVPYAKLAIAGALCYYIQNTSNTASLRDWMRFVRNIANNSRVEADTIHNILTAFKNWSKDCSTLQIKELIDKIDNKTPGIDSKQIEEEKKKVALLEQIDITRTIHHLENHGFFFGRIGFLFESLIGVDAKVYKQTLINHAEILYELFNNNGPNFDSTEDGYLIHRVLLACSEYHGIGYEYKRSWCLFESKEEWKEKYLEGEGLTLDENGYPYNIGIIRLLQEIGVPRNLNKVNLQEILSRYKTEVSDWRRPLIDHPGLWSYMGNNCLKFINNYSVLLLPRVVLQSSGRRAELRSRSLYLDLKYAKYLKNYSPQTEGEDYRPFGWELKFWEGVGDRKDKNSCIFFEKEFNGERIVIDVYFDMEYAHANGTEHSYCVELFVRESKREDEEIIRCNKSVWGDIAESLQFKRDIGIDPQGRYFLKHISKQDVINLLATEILQSKL